MRETIELTEKDYKLIERAGAIRLPMKYLAYLLGISKATLERIIIRDPVAKEALLKGRARASFAALSTLYDMAVVHKDMRALIFWMKTQEGLKETQILQHEASITNIFDNQDEFSPIIEAEQQLKAKEEQVSVTRENLLKAMAKDPFMVIEHKGGQP